MNSGVCRKCLYPCKTCISLTQCLTHMTDTEYEDSNIWLYVILGIIGAGLLLLGNNCK